MLLGYMSFAMSLVLFGVHHVEVLAADELGFGDRVVFARNQLVRDVLVVELFERVDVLLDNLRVVLPADELERATGRTLGLGRGSAARGWGSGGGRRARWRRRGARVQDGGHQRQGAKRCRRREKAPLGEFRAE